MSTDPEGPADRVRTRTQLAEGVRSILRVLRAVEQAEFSDRVPVDQDASDPIGALARAVNRTVDEYAATRKRTLDAQRAIEEQIATISKQRDVIRELAAPVIEVWAGVLCVPIVGIFEAVQAAETAESLLRALAEKDAHLAIIDLTGLDTMDTQTADHFLRMARAVHTLGVECVITGVSPNVAETVVALGVDMSSLRAFRTLREALKNHVAALRKGRRAARPGAGTPARAGAARGAG
jgi:rsbT co-antagonist protein RsbR